MSDIVEIKARLEYLRGELEKECMSYEELHELQSLAEFIEPGDVQLLEAAGVPEKRKRNRAPRKFDAFGGHRVGWYVHPNTRDQQRRMMPK